jgi:2',3'-cyclic-nucleotide 2'-phosphodiesterase (5'-nucleotidase family)
MLEGWLIVKSVVSAVPEAGTLPEPVQPEQTYCVTNNPSMGEATEARIDAPASNQPVVGVGEPCGEVTVNMY